MMRNGQIRLRIFLNLLARWQIFDLNIDMMQVSSGSRVPVMRFEVERGAEKLESHYAAMGQ